MVLKHSFKKNWKLQSLVIEMNLRTGCLVLDLVLKFPAMDFFYFETDKTLSILPSNKVKKVVQGDNTSEGSIIEVYFSKDVLTAEIIAVDGKSYFSF